MKGNCCSLVLSGYINGYSIIRELYAKGLRDIVLFDTEKNLAAYSNKLVKFVRIEPSVDSLYQALEALQREYERIVVYPTSEKHLEQLNVLYDKIQPYCFLPFNNHNLLHYIDKKNQYLHCEQCGIPYPKSVYIQEAQHLEQLRQLPYPMIVKPTKEDPLQPGVFRNLVLHSSADYERQEHKLRAYLARGVTFIASEIIPGDSSNIYVYVGYRDKQGSILNEWTGKKLSQYPNQFGVFSSAANQAPQVVLEQGRKLVETMNLFGIYEAEFKYDPREGTYKAIETNLRATMWNRVGHLSGVDIMYTQYLDAIGEQSVRQQQEQTREIHFVYFKYECLGLLKGTIPLTTFWKNLFCSDQTYFAVFDWKDIKPYLFDSLSLVTGVLKKVSKSLRIGTIEYRRTRHANHSNDRAQS